MNSTSRLVSLHLLSASEVESRGSMLIVNHLVHSQILTKVLPCWLKALYMVQ